MQIINNRKLSKSRNKECMNKKKKYTLNTSNNKASSHMNMNKMNSLKLSITVKISLIIIYNWNQKYLKIIRNNKKMRQIKREIHCLILIS